MDIRSAASSFFSEIQLKICAAVELADTGASFLSDLWERSDPRAAHGGGGVARVLRQGKVFEQAGVNFSEVQGVLPVEMGQKLVGRAEELDFYACGVSLVIHPRSPMVPTTHANFRYLEVADRSWFGGGADLTPYYLFEEDARHFHQTWKTACDRFDPEYYPRFKKECDQYFYLPHRGETRGVGGIFFDYIGRDAESDMTQTLDWVKELAESFTESYLPIVNRRKELAFTEAQKAFQLLRRGRYVEFNLLYDRGTLFGLRTGGRTESIFMSLPPEVRWEYNYQVMEGSEESKLIEVLKQPREWV